MFKRFVEGVGNTSQRDPKKIRILTAQKHLQEKTPSVIRPKPTDSSGQPFQPKPMGKKAGGRIGFSKGTGRSGVPAMDIKSPPTKKLSEKQKKIASLAGNPKKIDKPDFKVLQSRRKNKKII